MINGDVRKEKAVVLEELRKEVEKKPFVYEGTELNVTVTIGAADYETGLSTDEWIRKADEKLYFGKNHGKNQVVMCER